MPWRMLLWKRYFNNNNFFIFFHFFFSIYLIFYLILGLPGDEDNGEMSGWFVLCCLGLFNISPGENKWIAAVNPMFKKVYRWLIMIFWYYYHCYCSNYIRIFIHIHIKLGCDSGERPVQARDTHDHNRFNIQKRNFFEHSIE